MRSSGSDLVGAIHSAGLALSGESVVADVKAPSANRCRHGAKPHPCDPGYVHACHEERWRLATWRRSEPTQISWRPARCLSWRHDGPCRRRKASEDYSRIKEALGKFDRSAITYAVLTLDPSSWTAKGWARVWRKNGKMPPRPRREGAVADQASIGASYRALSDRWHAFATAMKREFGSFAYVSTVEQHRSGWPHLNVVFVNPELADAVKYEGNKLVGWGRKSRGREVARRVLGAFLESSGFGRIAFLEPALEKKDDHEDRLAAYIAKLAGDPGAAWDGERRGLLAPADDAPDGITVHSIEGQTIGEIAKFSQAPVRAPSHFRRLRSSKGFLPPKRRDEDVTGELFNESGIPVSNSPVERLRKAAIAADTYEACENVMVQAMAIENRYRERGNASSLGAMAGFSGTKLDIPDDFEARQPRGLRGIVEILAYIDGKIRGEAVVAPEPARRSVVSPGHALAPMDGMTLATKQDVEVWIGRVGPGMEHAVKKYRIGNRTMVKK